MDYNDEKLFELVNEAVFELDDDSLDSVPPSACGANDACNCCGNCPLNQKYCTFA